MDQAVCLHQTPMFHDNSLGALLAALSAGGVTTFVPSFEPGDGLDVTERVAVTMTAMVPTMSASDARPSQFRAGRLATLSTLTYGSSPMPAPLLDKLPGLFPSMDIFQGYGMTENAGPLTAFHRGRGRERLRS